MKRSFPTRVQKGISLNTGLVVLILGPYRE
jgi:hypothetical protein